MMQELLNVVHHHSNNPSSSINSSNSSLTPDQQPQQNLRCPRCDSSNTKFCYYNNYNLTQPRHFCKTCRRYWTKGGALRNVPIGGGCRKARTAASPTTITSGGPKGVPQKTNKPAMSASDIIGLGAASNLQLPPGLAPYSSHLLALLKASTQMQNPNCHNLSPNLHSSYRVKEEVSNTTTQQQNYYNVGSNTNNIYSNNGNYFFPSFAAANTMSLSTAAVMEPIPLHGGDAGFWNSSAGMGWSDISASNGAFP